MAMLLHRCTWNELEGIKTGEQKKMSSGATAWRNVGKSLGGRGMEAWQSW